MEYGPLLDPALPGEVDHLDPDLQLLELGGVRGELVVEVGLGAGVEGHAVDPRPPLPGELPGPGEAEDGLLLRKQARHEVAHNGQKQHQDDGQGLDQPRDLLPDRAGPQALRASVAGVGPGARRGPREPPSLERHLRGDSPEEHPEEVLRSQEALRLVLAVVPHVRGGGVGRRTLLPEGVVVPALLRVGEGLEGQGDPLEGLLGAGSPALVGVEPQGQPLVGPLDGGVVGVPGDAQSVVEVLRPQDAAARALGGLGGVGPRAGARRGAGAGARLGAPGAPSAPGRTVSGDAGAAVVSGPGGGGGGALQAAEQLGHGRPGVHPVGLLKEPPGPLQVAGADGLAGKLQAPVRLLLVAVHLAGKRRARGREEGKGVLGSVARKDDSSRSPELRKGGEASGRRQVASGAGKEKDGPRGGLC
ncbi:hypothetical protein HWI79_3621 [Cryptosporidium felis]|nr:hypothetical protein HWI79_3621 [Cryptosporidium felis]